MKIVFPLTRSIATLTAALVLNTALADGNTQLGSANDTVARNPATGEWTYNFYHPTEPDRSYTWRYIPRNQIKPAVRSSLRWDGRAFEYRYRVRNAKDAKQTISSIWMRAPIQIKEVPTTDEDVNMNVPQAQWQAELGKRFDARDALKKITIIAPSGWDTLWHINRKDFIGFGWFPDIKDNANLGMKPGIQQSGFAILRPELPGLAFAEMKGDVLHPEMLGGVPTSGAVSEAISQMQSEDSTWTHIMVPAMTVPVPWDGAELARRIKAHTQNWVKWQAMTPAMLDRLNPRFDTLIAALGSEDMRAVHQASVALMTEVFQSQRGMHHGLCLDDNEEFWQTPIPIVRSGGFPTLFIRRDSQPEMERIAVRALVFDMVYLLTRSYIGR